jgi:hypothetical protein
MPSPNSLRNLKPWQPGHSGNAGGRPKASLEIRALARQHTAEALNMIVKIMRNGRSDAVRLAAAEAILDRGVGSPSAGDHRPWGRADPAGGGEACGPTVS